MRQPSIYYLLFIFLYSSCNDSTNAAKESSEHVLLDTAKMERKAKNYIEAEEYYKAKLIYDTLITLDSTRGEYYFKRAYSKSLLMNNDSGAIADYHSAIYHKYQNEQSAYLSIGMLYKWRERFDSAIYYFNECLRINPENKRAQKEKNEVILKLNNLK